MMFFLPSNLVLMLVLWPAATMAFRVDGEAREDDCVAVLARLSKLGLLSGAFTTILYLPILVDARGRDQHDPDVVSLLPVYPVPSIAGAIFDEIVLRLQQVQPGRFVEKSRRAPFGARRAPRLDLLAALVAALLARVGRLPPPRARDAGRVVPDPGDPRRQRAHRRVQRHAGAHQVAVRRADRSSRSCSSRTISAAGGARARRSPRRSSPSLTRSVDAARHRARDPVRPARVRSRDVPRDVHAAGRAPRARPSRQRADAASLPPPRLRRRLDDGQHGRAEQRLSGVQPKPTREIGSLERWVTVAASRPIRTCPPIRPDEVDVLVVDQPEEDVHKGAVTWTDPALDAIKQRLTQRQPLPPRPARPRDLREAVRRHHDRVILHAIRPA